MIGRLALVVGLALFGAARPALGDGALRCDGGLVTAGDTAVDLEARCGPPEVREERLVERAEAGPGPWPGPGFEERRVTAVQERWSYNFGPGRFIELVTLEDGRVLEIRHGGYGYDPARLRQAAALACDPGPSIGDTTLDVLAKCGPPSYRARRQEERTAVLAAAPDGRRLLRRVTVAVETWTYDLGPRRLQVIATLDDGRVTALARGGYGHARPEPAAWDLPPRSP